MITPSWDGASFISGRCNPCTEAARDQVGCAAKATKMIKAGGYRFNPNREICAGKIKKFHEVRTYIKDGKDFILCLSDQLHFTKTPLPEK